MIENALKYTASGTVLIGCRRRRGELGLVVADTGKGIPPDQINAVFDEFYAATDRPHPRRGLGLGLAIVRGIAALLGLRTKITSSPRRGTLFEVAVPRAGDAS
ncbi:MAG: ATP-binding protein [Candidatus Competibacteraceae bacterium]|nr:ATP-binding protein [Candidatus Competibacteraceae bacterium]